MTPKTLLVVVGATGIGKTALAVQLAKHYKTEILSADSRQFYREMSIGTAVPDKEELLSAPHHFIQHKSIHETYTVGDFERDAIELLEHLYKKHELVIMVGGSGLYIDAVLYGMDSFPHVATSIRTTLNKELEKDGLAPLQKELISADPHYAQKVDLQNPQRVLRALEVWRASGKPYSSFLRKKKTLRPFNTIILGIEAPREIIYQRINKRVDCMMASGLLNEVSGLEEYKRFNALQTVGYKELFQYLNGNCSIEEAIEEIKKNTRRYAKRQGTWFRKKNAILWIPFELSFNLIVAKIERELQKQQS